ncbi:hypothetical protein [Halocynthiibacter namhaensis]|uniref:hypothetical protein n=1 Tax=Halocynthiibacter namhaensis TaxID=1290553 RepID=UPI00057986FE|nr:hypothetical protein [Halocynthiibacter namhaensis]
MWIDDIWFRWELAKLQKKKASVWEDYREDLETAEASKDWDSEREVASEAFTVEELHGWEIRSLQHNYVTKQAEVLLLPMPSYRSSDVEWEYCEHDDRWYLNAEILSTLAKEVRRERRERAEILFLWPMSLIGAVGGVIGIVSAFL